MVDGTGLENQRAISLAGSNPVLSARKPNNDPCGRWLAFLPEKAKGSNLDNRYKVIT